ncbi:YfhO family protein [Enterococcus sp. BWR-S5]|uniref:YfhO family protein n=1 Tax=Enterococcus sp. BWR-S5 TaxID=2787714 RepID=UPI0019241B03|nr:YfhO family protein [Enterococcus sp. BWR-S5]MBL1227547.1 YfhO family protein [Enterococcus sp. BWR-S5]
MKPTQWKGVRYLAKNRWILGLSFFLPIVILAGVYLMIGIYPGSNRTIMASDSFHQLSNFLASYNTMMKGSESIFYSWYVSFGLNYWAFISYYLGGIFTPLVYLFDNSQIPDALYFLTLLKFGCSGLAFSVFSLGTFKLPRWGYPALSISYALMSFALAFSEMIMWLDAFVYLPLVILGIHRVLEQRKPLVLFVSYLLLFVTNFYMAFIVGFFSFLYFLTRLVIDSGDWKRKVGDYLGTSLLAGGASMPVILPTILDLRNNGEALSAITSLKTEDTGVLDLFVKNFVGVYDTTQFGSTPFVFIGLWSLILCVYYYTVKEIPLKEKLAYSALGAFVIFSFYFEPLNLFWQGLHAPNMFLFRYSFVLSFLVILLAGYGWEHLSKASFDRMSNLVLGLVFLFVGVRVYVSFGDTYRYITVFSFIMTLVFLFLYLLFLRVFLKKKTLGKLWVVLFLCLISVEAGVNTYVIFQGIKKEWVYPARNRYLYHYDDISGLVAQTKEDNDSFYRMETMHMLTKNDSLNYGYSGVGMFSSIRNRNSLSYLHELGYRSWGTNLQNDYRNNTILMDMISGIKYNLSQEEINKYGFKKINESGEYVLYENQYAMPLGVMTDRDLYVDGAGKNQTSLFNLLANQKKNYYTFIDPELVDTEHVTIEDADQMVTYIKTDKKEKEPMRLTWKATIPKNKQAYFSLYPLNYDDLKSAEVILTVNGVKQQTRINMTGQYYNLGYYEEETEVEYTIELSDTVRAQFLTPDIALLDIEEYTEAAEAILDKGVNFEVSGRKAKATVTVTKDDPILFTTIPYDKGWKVYVDGKEAEITPFRDAFLSVQLEEGTHEVEFVFLPQGLLLGSGISGVSLLIFGGYLFILKRRKNDPFYQTPSDSSGAEPKLPKPTPVSTVEEETASADSTPISEETRTESPTIAKESSTLSSETTLTEETVGGIEEETIHAHQEEESLLSSFSFGEGEDFGFALHTETELKERPVESEDIER